MRAPDDPFAPVAAVFPEPWMAETLALADAMVRGGHFTAAAWAQALGAALAGSEAAGAPDTETTYYTAALAALESLVPLSAPEVAARKAAWAAAYRDTPHGRPVTLP